MSALAFPCELFRQLGAYRHPASESINPPVEILLQATNIKAYLRRIGLAPSDLGLEQDRESGRDGGSEHRLAPNGELPSQSAIQRLQRAYLTLMPFDTLSVSGGLFGRLEPTSDWTLLEPESLHQKIVEED